MLQAHVSRRLWVHLQPCIVRTVKKLLFLMEGCDWSFLPSHSQKGPHKDIGAVSKAAPCGSMGLHVSLAMGLGTTGSARHIELRGLGLILPGTLVTS